MEQFDICVIGSGPGGYVGAIRAAQLGAKVCLIEKFDTFGGTCANVGCIPSKALLHASECYWNASNDFSKLGINCSPELDLEKLFGHKKETVKANVSGVSYLLKKNKITTYIGVASFMEPGVVKVESSKGEIILKATNIIIATGSEVASLPGVEIDNEVVVSSTGMLALDSVPKNICVVGGGVIGLELGSVWSRLGSNVEVVEYLPSILVEFDKDVAKAAQREFSKQGIKFILNSAVINCANHDGKAELTVKDNVTGKEKVSFYDTVLIAVGRKPYTTNLGLEKIGLDLDERGRIPVGSKFETSVSGVFAIGDVIKGPMLAHKAEEEAIACVESIFGEAGHVNYDTIPSVLYTSPEVAMIGISEKQAKQQGIKVKVGSFPFVANGRARATLATQGFVKLIVSQEDESILGAQIVGHIAGDIIHEVAVLMEYSGSCDDLARICHAHPTLSEGIREAGLIACGRGIHI